MHAEKDDLRGLQAAFPVAPLTVGEDLFSKRDQVFLGRYLGAPVIQAQEGVTVQRGEGGNPLFGDGGAVQFTKEPQGLEKFRKPCLVQERFVQSTPSRQHSSLPSTLDKARGI